MGPPHPPGWVLLCPSCPQCSLWDAGAGGSGGEAVPGNWQPDTSHDHQLHLGIGSTSQNGLWEEFLGQGHPDLAPLLPGEHRDRVEL